MFTSLEKFLEFAHAGKAIFTLVSKKTGDRYTYKISVKKETDKNGKEVITSPFFIGLMTGTDNERSYTQFSHARQNILNAKPNQKRRLADRNKGVLGFYWLIRNIHNPKIMEQVEFHHSGKCGRCGRTLTVPSSIESGFGPECQKYIPRQKDFGW